MWFENPNCPGCWINDWSPDGKLAVISQHPEKTLELWLVPRDGSRRPYPYIQSLSRAYFAQFSPDSQWLAYVADQAPRAQIIVESIPAGKVRRQISSDGGDWPIWRRDGKELFYRNDTRIVAVPITLTATSVQSGEPRTLFEVPSETRFQVSRDGQRFLIAMPVEGSFMLSVDTDWRMALGK